MSLKMSEEHYQNDHRLEKTRLDAFDCFYNTERMTFYQIQESHVLLHLYGLVASYANKEQPEAAQQLLGAIMMCFHTCYWQRRTWQESSHPLREKLHSTQYGPFRAILRREV
jgi:hypothetical protein